MCQRRDKFLVGAAGMKDVKYSLFNRIYSKFVIIGAGKIGFCLTKKTD